MIRAFPQFTSPNGGAGTRDFFVLGGGSVGRDMYARASSADLKPQIERVSGLVEGLEGSLW